MTPTEWLGPLADPHNRLYLPFLAGAVVLAAVAEPVWRWRRRTGRTHAPRAPLSGLFSWAVWSHPSSVLDLQLAVAKGLLRWAGVLPAVASSVGGARWLARWLGRTFGFPELSLPGVWPVLLYSLALFASWDLSRYLLHRALHRSRLLWGLHQVHHSAEVLTPATFYRTHPGESLLFVARGVLTTSLVAGVFMWLFGARIRPFEVLGVHVLGFVFNLLGGNLRHSQVWMSWGPLERWFLSPAQHQIHHSADPADFDSNFGTWLSLWDRLGGTWRAAGAPRALAFGLPEDERNHHPHSLRGALLGPLGLSLLLGLLSLPLAPAVAQAQEDDDEPGGVDDDQPGGREEESGDAGGEDGENEGDENDDDDEVDDDVTGGEGVSVFGSRIRPARAAGSAHAVGEEELEQFENNDIHRILAPVPGVYVRGEDGFGLRPNIGIRGANSDRSSKVTLLEDGILLGPAPYSAPAAYYFPLATRMVGVEVFKGPAAIQHGPQTIGGAINLQSRAIPEQLDGAIDAAIGLRGTFKLHGWGGARAPWGGLLFEAVQLSTEGFKELDGEGDTGFDKTELLFRGQLNTPLELARTLIVELKAGWARESSRETYLGLSPADFEASPYRRYAASQLGLMTWDRTQVELSAALNLDYTVRLRLTGYHHWMQRSWRKLNGFAGGTGLRELLNSDGGGQAGVFRAILRGEEDTQDDDQQLVIGTNARSYHSYGVQLTGNWLTAGRVVVNSLDFGVRLHADEINRDHTELNHDMINGTLVESEGAEVETTTLNQGRALALSAWLYDDLEVGPVRFLPGVRLELVRTGFEDRLSGGNSEALRAAVMPGFGFHASPTEWLSLLAGVHRGFSPVAPGQPEETRPEQAWNYEGGARFEHGRFFGEAIGFFSDYQNLTGNCTFSAGCEDALIDQQFNAGAVHVFGAEVALQQDLLLPKEFTLGLRGSYTFTGSRFRTAFTSLNPQLGTVEVGDRLPYVPEHRGNLGVTLGSPLAMLGLSLAAQSVMRDVPGQGEIPEAELIPAHAVLDLAGELRLNRHVRLYATVNNLLNSSYIVSRRPYGARPGRPLHAMFGVKVQGVGGPEGLVERGARRRAAASAVVAAPAE